MNASFNFISLLLLLYGEGGGVGETECKECEEGEEGVELLKDEKTEIVRVERGEAGGEGEGEISAAVIVSVWHAQLIEKLNDIGNNKKIFNTCRLLD